MKLIAFALVLLLKQESIPGECVPSACQPYMLQSQMSVPVERGGPQVNKFEKVSTPHVSSRGQGGGPMSDVRWEQGLGCPVSGGRARGSPV